MLGSYVGVHVTVIAIELGERTGLVLDDLDTDAPIVFQGLAKLVTVVNSEGISNSSRNVCLISRNVTFGSDPVAAHVGTV